VGGQLLVAGERVQGHGASGELGDREDRGRVRAAGGELRVPEQGVRGDRAWPAGAQVGERVRLLPGPGARRRQARPVRGPAGPGQLAAGATARRRRAGEEGALLLRRRARRRQRPAQVLQGQGRELHDGDEDLLEEPRQSVRDHGPAGVQVTQVDTGCMHGSFINQNHSFGLV